MPGYLIKPNEIEWHVPPTRPQYVQWRLEGEMVRRAAGVPTTKIGTLTVKDCQFTWGVRARVDYSVVVHFEFCDSGHGIGIAHFRLVYFPSSLEDRRDATMTALWRCATLQGHAEWWRAASRNPCYAVHPFASFATFLVIAAYENILADFLCEVLEARERLRWRLVRFLAIILNCNSHLRIKILSQRVGCRF